MMRNAIFGFLALILILGTARADVLDDPISEDAVREMLFERLAAAPEVQSATVRDDGGLDIVLANGTSPVLYLDNMLLQITNSNPSDRAGVLDNFVRALVAMNIDSFNRPALESLRWSVYDSSYLRDAFAVKGAGENFEMTFVEFMQPREKIAGDIWAVIVKDRPTSVSTMSLKELEKNGIEVDAARAAADMSMLALAGQALIHEGEQHGIHIIELDGYYENALMTVPEFWTDLAIKMGGEIVTATPARRLVFFTIGNDPANLDLMTTLAQRLHANEAHPISPELFRWTGGGWAVFEAK